MLLYCSLFEILLLRLRDAMQCCCNEVLYQNGSSYYPSKFFHHMTALPAVVHYSPAATSAANATNQYGLLITVSDVGIDFSQTHGWLLSISVSFTVDCVLQYCHVRWTTNPVERSKV